MKSYRAWVTPGTEKNMTELKNCYVIDTLDNIEKYAGISENFKKACDVIAKGGFESFAPGRHEIAGVDVYVNRDTATYVHQNERRPEFHREYFDIHVPLENDERMGLAAYDEKAPCSFDATKDCGFTDQKVEYFTVKKGEFAICWPGTCAHAPAITTDEPKKSAKLIVKIRAR